MEYRLEYAGKQVGEKTFKTWADAQRGVLLMFDEVERRLIRGQKMHTALRKLRTGLSIVRVPKQGSVCEI